MAPVSRPSTGSLVAVNDDPFRPARTWGDLLQVLALRNPSKLRAVRTLVEAEVARLEAMTPDPLDAILLDDDVPAVEH